MRLYKGVFLTAQIDKLNTITFGGDCIMTINDAVAKRIKKLLKQQNKTQYRLEKSSFIAHGAMNNILAGKNKTVTLTTVYRLAQGFNMSINEFLDDKVFRSEELELE